LRRLEGRRDNFWTVGRGCAMKDVVYVGLTVVFFAISWLYVRACERV
jgi:hypothetical protein